MKQHKFKRIAIDLIERIQSDRYQIEYKYDVIWFYHFSDKYTRSIESLCMINNIDDDKTILTVYEKVKKVLAGEELIDETNSDLSH